MRLVSSITGVLGAAIAALAIVLINGGYVYRTQCPHIGGSTETSWSYRINAILPYVGYSRTGCEVHTATRLALNWAGIWNLHSAAATTSSGSPVTATPNGHQGDYTQAQRTFMQSHCVSTGKSVSFCGCAMAELTRVFTPTELGQISAVTRYEQLPASLAKRAYDENTAIAQDCH